MPNLPSLSASSRKGNAAPPGKEVLLKTPSSAAHQAKGPPPVSDREAREAARLARKDANEIKAALEVSMKTKARNEAFNSDIQGLMAGTLRRPNGRLETAYGVGQKFSMAPSKGSRH